jgi:5-methylcytosine-specific restriction protein A
VKRTALRQVSKKQRRELARRSALKKELIVESHGLCMHCGQPPDWRGLQLVHKVPLARGGKTTKGNCEVWCGRCHSADHGIHERQI